MPLKSQSMIDIIVADDNEMYHSGLDILLKKIKLFDRITHVWNGKEVLAAMKEHPYQFILMDYRMPVMDGAACTREVKKRFSFVKVIGLSLYDDCASVLAMVDNGVDGYILKNTSKEEIETAVKKIVNGKHYFTPEVSRFVIDKAVEKHNSSSSPFSDRENEILRLMWVDQTTKEISSQLNISERTVEGHRHNMFLKANARTIVGLIKYALRNRIITSFSAE